jgi:hypothetical protein
VNEFLRSAAVSRKNGPVAAEGTANRFTVAKKNGTSAETYGEPQTPVTTASRLHFHLNSPSLAQPPMSRNGLYSSGSISLRSIDFRASTGHHAKNSGFCHA